MGSSSVPPPLNPRHPIAPKPADAGCDLKNKGHTSIRFIAGFTPRVMSCKARRFATLRLRTPRTRSSGFATCKTLLLAATSQGCGSPLLVIAGEYVPLLAKGPKRGEPEVILWEVSPHRRACRHFTPGWRLSGPHFQQQAPLVWLSSLFFCSCVFILCVNLWRYFHLMGSPILTLWGQAQSKSLFLRPRHSHVMRKPPRKCRGGTALDREG